MAFCTITSSNLKAITAGSRVVYLQAAGASSLDSDIVLVVGPGNYRDSVTSRSISRPVPETLTLSGGTGQFASFHAKAAVSSLGGTNWAWDGTYSFSPRDGDQTGDDQMKRPRDRRPPIRRARRSAAP